MLPQAGPPMQVAVPQRRAIVQPILMHQHQPPEVRIEVEGQSVMPAMSGPPGFLMPGVPQVFQADQDAVEIHISQPPVVAPSQPPQPPMPPLSHTTAFVCSNCGRRYPWPGPPRCNCHGPSPEPDPRDVEPAPESNDQLWQAARDANRQLVEQLLSQPGFDVNYARVFDNATLPHEVTVLGAAMLGENMGVVKLLLKSKAQLQQVDVEILSMLLCRQIKDQPAKDADDTRGTNNQRDCHKLKQLWWAAYDGFASTVDNLLKDEIVYSWYKRFGDTTFPHEVTVLGAAMLGEHARVVKLLLKSKAQLQQVDVEILSRLLCRPDKEATEIVKALLVETEGGEGLGKLRNRIGCVLAPLDGLDVTPKSEQWWTGPAMQYYNDLEHQSMFYPTFAQVKHCILPLPPRLAYDPKILAALVSTDNLEMLDLDVVNAIISVAWVQHIRSSVIDNLVNVVNVVLLCWLSYNYSSNPSSSDLTLAWILAILHLKETCECLASVWHIMVERSTKGTFLIEQIDIYNCVDNVYTVIGTIVLGQQLAWWHIDEASNKALLALFCGMAWLRLLASLRGYTWLGLRFLPIIGAILDSASFFFITGTCLLASAHAYYQMGPRKEDPLPLFSAFVIPFRLGILGDFDLFEFEGKDTKYVEGNDTETDEVSWVPKDPEPGDDHLFIMVIFFVTSIGISFVLMNIFIAVLTQNLQLFQNRDRLLLTKSRAKMVLEWQKRPLTRLLHCILGRCCQLRCKYKLKDTISTSGPTWTSDVPAMALFWSLSPLRVVFGNYGHTWIWHQCTNHRITVLLFYLSPWLLSVSLVMMILCLTCGFFFRLSGIQHEMRVLFLGICGWKTDSDETDPPEQVTAYRAKQCVIHVFVNENEEHRSQGAHFWQHLERQTHASMEKAMERDCQQWKAKAKEEAKEEVKEELQKKELLIDAHKEEIEKLKERLWRGVQRYAHQLPEAERISARLRSDRRVQSQGERRSARLRSDRRTNSQPPPCMAWELLQKDKDHKEKLDERGLAHEAELRQTEAHKGEHDEKKEEDEEDDEEEDEEEEDEEEEAHTHEKETEEPAARRGQSQPPPYLG
ncbi:unnamed protein product [Durusdinium trenchii]|uniref:Ion transport domain-containing protein n=1 Tax=Durusdinium trenchii TaxID=1381693 RepID=A0ABP0JUB1_9DINO